MSYQSFRISYMTIEYNLAMSQSIGQHPDLQTIRQWTLDPQHIKKVEEIVDQHYANTEVMDFLLKLVVSNSAQYPSQQAKINAYQSYGCILNRMLDKYYLTIPSESIVKEGIDTCFKLVFSWDFLYLFKKCMITSFVSLLNSSKAIIGEFFEDVWEVLIRMAGQLDNLKLEYSGQVFETRIVHQAIGKQFIISIPFTTSRQEIYHTLILIGQGIFLSEDFKKNQKSQERLIENFKKIHQILFKEENIEKYYDVFRQIFKFWQDFNLVGLDRNKGMIPAYHSISRWGGFAQDIELILSFKAPKNANNCPFYFLLTDDQESSKIVQLKTQAFDIFNELLQIEEDALQVPVIETPFGQSIDNICQSVIASLEFLVSNKQLDLPEDIEELQIYMLSTLQISISFDRLLHKKVLTDILFSIVFPLINSELQHLENNCETEEELRMMLDDLNDCCQNQQALTVLSIACKILENIASDQAIRFTLRINSFLALIQHLQLTNELSYQPEIRLGFSVPMAFLILTLLQFNKQEMQMERNLMKILVAPESFKKLNPWNKRFCFHYISHMASIFQDDEPQLLDFYMHYCIDHPLIDKDPFYYDLVVNICPHYSSELTAKIFYQSIIKSDNNNICNEKCSVFSIIIKKHLNVFSQEKIVKLIEILLQEVKKRIKGVINSILQSRKYEQSPAVPLSILCQISTDFQYVREKPNVIRALYSTMDLIHECCKVNAEDFLVQIVGNLIEATHVLPQSFDIMLNAIKQAFQGSQFKGHSYYHLYGQAIDVISSYINDNTNEQYKDRGIFFAEKVYDILVEGFAYFTTFPDDYNSEIYNAISSLQIIFEKMLILLGDTLPQICIQEMKGLCATLLALFRGTKQYFLRSRTQNLRFICEFLSTKDYHLEEILQMVSSQHYAGNNDTIIFIFLASKIRGQLVQDQQLLLVLIILYYIQSNLALKKSSIDIRNMLRQQNSIFNFIYMPFDTCSTPVLQARAFFTSFEEEDPQMKAKILERLNGEMYANLSHIIDRIFKQDYSQAQNFNEEIKDMTSTQLEQNSDSSQSYYSEQENNFAKRRIVKVVERTNESAQKNYISHQIMAKKREFEFDMTEDIDSVEMQRKMRKIEEFEPEKSKKEILKEKKNRKIQRL